MLEKLPADQREFVGEIYAEALRNLERHYELQEGSWKRNGAPSIHKQVLYASATRRIVPHPTLDFSEEDVGFGSNAASGGYLDFSGETVNAQEDLSWKPDSSHS
jgi:hypothetical protein